MKIQQFENNVALHRKEKVLYAELLRPHRCLTTSRVHGGISTELNYIINHQACEPSKHSDTDLFEVAVKDPLRYLKRIADKAELLNTKAALLTTAANMNNAGMAEFSYEGLRVQAVCTAGIGSNAGRAGDPAAYQQTASGIQSLRANTEATGTIVTMLFINQELSEGALVIAATVATEAKSALLHELTARSCASQHIATGTGTDQIAIAACLGTECVHHDANKHSKLGELIGLSVESALRQALNLQAGITPDSRRSSLLQMERFGETADAFRQSVAEALPEQLRALFQNNFLSVNHDPVTVGAVQACIHVYDQITWGVLPRSCAKDLLFHQAALIARAVSGKFEPPSPFADGWELEYDLLNSKALLLLIRQAFARGFTNKWHDRFTDSFHSIDK